MWSTAACREPASQNSAVWFSAIRWPSPLLWMLACYICYARGNLQTKVKCCRADDSQILKNQILRNIFKPHFSISKRICASTSPCPSWCMCGSTRILSFLCFKTLQVSNHFLASTTSWASRAERRSLRSGPCPYTHILASGSVHQIKNFSIFWGWWSGCFNALCYTRNWILLTRAEISTPSSLPLVNSNTTSYWKANLWWSVG